MAYTTRIAGAAAALAALGLLGTGLTGCSAKVETKSAPTISAADLQKRLTDQFAGADSPPKSVTCADELVGEVGKTATCDVQLSDTNTVEAVVTVSNVDESNVSFDIMPALSKQQLEKAIAGMGVTGTVSCDSGIDGKIGATAQCQSTADGVVTKRVVEVGDVSGLQMDVSVTRLLPKEMVGEVLMQKLSADGKPVETVDCVDDVVAKTGNNVECATVTGNAKQGYVVTVTTVEEDTFDIDYKDAP